VPRHAAAALLLLVATASFAADPRVFTVGVLRADGVIIPFAAWDGAKWRVVWPEPKQDLEIPINVASVPKSWWGPAGPADTWQAWTAAPPITLPVRQTELVPANCLRQIGLRTNYHRPELPPPISDHPYPKDGLFVAPSQRIELVDVLPRSAPEWTEFAPLVTDAFNAQERALAKRQDFDHPVAEKTREGTPPVIEAIYAYGSEPRFYVVEAAREYWRAGNGRCIGLAFGRMWIRRQQGGAKVMLASVGLERCDREDTLYMLPLGVTHVGNRLFWIAQLAGWDAEEYDVFEIMPAEVKQVLTKFGGWC
jgi:hypothetical protein